jgi:ubiquitin C-terminal hydrolase
MENSSTQFKSNSTKNFISNKSNEKELEDNLIQKLFGGKMISSVTCIKCRKSFNKIDGFLGVSLEINKWDNLDKCFSHFCKAEHLTGNNKYYCENCKSKNDSIKKISFEKCKNDNIKFSS